MAFGVFISVWASTINFPVPFFSSKIRLENLARMVFKSGSRKASLHYRNSEDFGILAFLWSCRPPVHYYSQFPFMLGTLHVI